MKSGIFSGISVLIILTATFSYSDTIILNEGQSLTGKILIEKEKQLIIDLGVAVLVVPKDKVLEYQIGLPDEKETTDANSGTDTVTITSQPDKLYSTAKLKKMPIEECVETVSQAVVKVSTPAGMGSGFFFNDQGYLITNYHVIEKETKIEITVFQKSQNGFEKKKFKNVEIKAINQFIDLAILKVEDLGDEKIKFVYLGNIDQIKVGEKVFAIGNPLGLERTVTDGVISTKNRAFEGLIYLQTNADINPGNSGGPLFNLAGEVVGVTNMGYIFYGGLGFAIPINYVKDFIENRDAFAYDKDNANTGFRYIQPDPRKNHENPDFSKQEKNKHK